MKLAIAIILFCCCLKANESLDLINLDSVKDINAAVTELVGKINKEPDIEKKKRVLADLKDLIDSNSDTTGERTSDLSDEVTSLETKIKESTDESEKQKLKGQLKEKEQKFTHMNQLFYQWNLFQGKFEPLFDLFLDHHNAESNDPSELNCSTIINIISNRSKTKTEVKPIPDTIKIAQDMCSLTK